MSVALHPQYVVDESGKRRSVVLSIEEWEALLQEREDMHDVALLTRLKAESTPEDFMSLEDFEAELRAEGKL